jgi:hypothetical protein
MLENGDKIFSRTALIAQSLGSGTTSAGTITGGTGKLAGIRGILRTTGTAQPTAGVNENQTDIEYWFQKQPQQPSTDRTPLNADLSHKPFTDVNFRSNIQRRGS